MTRLKVAVLILFVAVLGACGPDDPQPAALIETTDTSLTTTTVETTTTTVLIESPPPSIESTPEPVEPIQCEGYGHPLHHLTCDEANEIASAWRPAPAESDYAPSPPATRQAATAAPSSSLASIRDCESGGDYSTDTGNGYYGAYQFDQSTWESVGGSGNPANASPAEQDQRAATLQSQRGNSPWPTCG